MKKIILTAIVFISGCVTVGREITPEQVKALEKGKTTIAEATTSLGKPTGSTLLSDGKQILTYTFAHAQSRPESFIPLVGAFVGGADVRSSMVMLTFDKDGILREYTSSQHNSGSGYGVAAGAYQQPDRTLPAQAK